MIKIGALSDGHGYLPKVDTCDIVLICGDMVPLDCQGSSQRTWRWYRDMFKLWANNLPCNKVLFIAGNHDIYLENHIQKYHNLFPYNEKVTYLEHESYQYEGEDGNVYNIFGTPYCKIFMNWAFMRNSYELENLFSSIPSNLDILMTHDQPYGYGDVLLQDVSWNNHNHIGNKELANAVIKNQPNLLLSGHLHSTDHSPIQIGHTIRYNVSIKDEKYEVAYPVTYINYGI